jgi:serine/threonine protein kinase
MVEHPAADNWPGSTGGASADRPEVPGFEIVDELGRGGMGVVYKARRADSGQLVALKMIRDGALAGPQQRGRFRIEAEAVARMRHANIVRIDEVGEHAGLPYLVMELVEGDGLDKHLASQPWRSADAAGLVRTLALAVQHAHERKIIHRDLKPANIVLLTADGVGQPVPKITDFGLAKRLDADSTAWTLEGAVPGTPAYMAPEQAAGHVNEVGPAVDIYALGVILYEALTGRPPFQADSRSATIQLVLHEEPEPPGRLQPDVPRDLETVCLKCLEKEPARRYASAADLADDLGRFLENRPVTAVPAGATERLTRIAARDGYQILSEVGRGPGGIVYHAHYGRLKQAVTLKVFAAGTCTREEWESQLRGDAERWATLAHPQVVAVQRAGWWDGAPYLAREYVPQGSLAVKLTGRPWPVREALGLVEQLALIVAYLHRQGVVHGNLKPGNVLLAADGIPRLTDFRLSGGLFQCPPPEDARAPAALAYLAPELTEPDADPRPHADIYGLGVILYELLTGRPPFAAPDGHAMLTLVRTQDPEPPSRLNAEVKPHVEHLCLRCLHKDRWRRYTRAYDVSTQLRRYMEE